MSNKNDFIMIRPIIIFILIIPFPLLHPSAVNGAFYAGKDKLRPAIKPAAENPVGPTLKEMVDPASPPAGDEVRGIVQESDDQGDLVPLPFVNVYWSGSTHGTVTGEDGRFTIERVDPENVSLVFSFVGFGNDTIPAPPGEDEVKIVLIRGETIDEVVISERLGGSYISKLRPIKTEFITTEGLQKLPCCNLSESFENSATIDVGYSDAVTGARHIKMLGLAGIYSQMMYENIPYLRGLESAFGLNYVPGPWMESIQISKGAAGVVNGYESTTGQINVEYKKPETSEPLFVNLFANSTGRMEANLTSAAVLNDKVSTMLLAHGSGLQNRIDRNGDGFMDVPLSRQVNLMSRWKFNPEGNIRGQLGFTVMDEKRDGGQMGFEYESHAGTTDQYGTHIATRKYQGFGKLGILFPDKPYMSIGFQAMGTYYSQEGTYGLRRYLGEQQSFYTNLIWQSIILTTDHTINLGASYQYDDYLESLDLAIFDRREIVSGVFGQYTYTRPEKFNGILGLRVDHNSRYGWLVTPRLHMRYAFSPHTSLRASAGRGYRSANPLSENTGVLASSRLLFFDAGPGIEKAWNYGVNLTHDFHMAGGRDIEASLDLYRTDFQDRVVVDMDRDAQRVYFYNLNGESFANSFQAQVGMEPVERFDITLAYRFNDVRSTIDGHLREVPLTSRSKGLLTLSYATPFRKWAFDLTTQLNGQTRLPDTQSLPPEYRKGEYSPGYLILHAQVSKRFKWFELYAGGENLTDFTQEDPILAADDPFGEDFDASMIWGPLLGRRFYAGIRFTLE